MAYQANAEPLEPLTLTTDMNAACDNIKLMLQFGYLGNVTFEAGGMVRINFTAAEAVPIAVSTGDTILYRTTPALAVVKCVTPDELATNFHTV